MYCPQCREERLTLAQVCAICGGEMASRSKDEIAAELAHVHYVLADANHWGRTLQADAAKTFVQGHYQRRERLLSQALRTDATTADAFDPPAAAQPFEPVMAEQAVGNDDAIVDALPVPAPLFGSVTRKNEYLTPPDVDSLAVGGEPVFDIPSTPTETERVVEQVSTWKSVWRPFLYESIGWFIGAFLVVAGSVYFVALGWSGLSDLGRGLTIFGLAAGYSAAFSVVGSLLLRRPALAGAGKVVSLIGSAMAPFAPLALGAVASQSPFLFWGLTLAWAAAAHALVGAPARAYEPSSARALRFGLATTVVSVGAAPLVVSLLGTGAVWSGLWALLFVAAVLRADGASPRSAERAAYAFLAPTYLAAVALIRLNAAMNVGGVPVALATYAPFAAAMVFLALRAWPRTSVAGQDLVPPERSGEAAESKEGDQVSRRGSLDFARDERSSPLHTTTPGSSQVTAAAAVSAIAAQWVCVVAAGFGQAPAFFITSAFLVWTALWLSRNAKGGARWLYVTYAAGYLAYQSVGQLVPGWLQELLVKVRLVLGYEPGAALPFNYAAVYAIPYVVVGAWLAVRTLRKAGDDERLNATAETLLRCTAAATAFFALEGAFGTDLRPAMWTVPPLAILAIALGVALRRPYLSWAGWGASLVAPIAFTVMVSSGPGSLVAALFALALGILAWRVRDEPAGAEDDAQAPVRHLFALGAVLQTFLAAGMAWNSEGTANFTAVRLLALVAASAAAWLVAVRTSNRFVEAWALVLSLSVAPFAALAWAPGHAPMALAIVAVGAALVPTRSAPVLAVLTSILAAYWQYALHDGGPSSALGIVLLLGVAASAISARRLPLLGAVGAVFWGLAVLPNGRSSGDGTLFPEWPWLTPIHTGAILMLTALGASAWTAWKQRSPSTLSYAAVAVLGLVGNGVLFGLLNDRFGPVLLVAAFGVAFASRALRAEVCLPLATLLALSHLGLDGHGGRLVLAAVLTALTLLERAPALRDRVLGGATATLTAGLCAAGVLAVGLLAQPEGALEPVLLVATTLLPLVSLWATRAHVFAALPLVLGALATITVGSWAVAVPVTVAVVLSHVVSRGGERFGDGAWREAHALWMQGGLIAAIALVVVFVLAGAQVQLWERSFLPIGVAALPLTILAACVLLVAGRPLHERIVVASTALLFAPWARGFGSAVAIAVGLAAMHAGPRLRQWLAAPDDQVAPKFAGAAASVLAVSALLDVPLWSGWLLAPAVAFFFAAVLLEDSRWVTVAAVALGVSVSFGRSMLEHPLSEPAALLVSALVAAVAAALWRLPAVRARAERLVRRISPRIDAGFERPLWAAAALQLGFWVTGLVTALWRAPVAGESVLALCTAALLWIAFARAEVVISAVLWTATVAIALPEGINGLVVAGTGLLLAYGGWRKDASTHHHVGWAMGAVALLLSGGIGHGAFPWVVGLSLATAWMVVGRRPSLEWLGWIATGVAAHLFVFHLGAVLSTGRGKEFILPHLAAAMGVVSAVAALLPASKVRRTVLLAFGTLCCLEVGAGLISIEGGAGREALAALGGLLVLFGALIYAARRDEDEAPAYLAQVALLLAYLAVRFHGFGAELQTRDGLIALVGGALFSGFHVWVKRNAEWVKAFRRPALFGAYAFPLVGLFATPWEEPLIAAAVLIGHAAHFTVLAGTGARRSASVVAAAAFNLALYFAWQGSHAGQAEYYVIPFGLSLLVLSRVFAPELSVEWQARLRAIAITTIYSASAWRALLFSDGLALGICALACVVGVAAGIALRIRSFVYLGTGFLVTSVIANLVRTGISQPHLGALFLSVLGVLVVGFMVLFTAQRAELLRRYQQMRALLDDWEG